MSECRGFAILAAFWSELGLGSVRNGFLAKNYVAYPNSQPKRLSGRPFVAKTCFTTFLVGTRPRECQKRIPREKLCSVGKFSAQTVVWEAMSWPNCVL